MGICGVEMTSHDADGGPAVDALQAAEDGAQERLPFSGSVHVVDAQDDHRLDAVLADPLRRDQLGETAVYVVRIDRAVQVREPVTVGGDIRNLDDIRALLNAGADKVSINSAAVRDPEFVRKAARRFGSQCIVVNIDPKRVPRDGEEFWEVHINGGRVPTGLEAVSWARDVEKLGAGEIVLTSMDADGTENGYDLEMTRAVVESVRIPVVASGGAGKPEHLRAVLAEAGASAALAASIFHYQRYSIRETKEYLASWGVPVRITELAKPIAAGAAI